MRHLSLALAALAVVGVGTVHGKEPTFKKLQLTDKFHCEGAHFADFNKDGKIDVVSGPYWYEGPDFTKKHEVRKVQSWDPKDYSDNFLTYTGDFNGDGWADIFYLPFPGKEGYWHENPAGKEGPWKQHLAFKVIDNESPMMADITGDGKQELLFNTGPYMGFASPNPAKPDEPWEFTPLTTKGNYQRFTHGIGCGDVDGDGLIDLLEGNGWWKRPADWKPGQPWVFQPFKFADSAAQMYVYDVDGDKLNDVITTWHCHQYGMLWYKQVRDAAGKISFQQQVILPIKPDMNSDAFRISQLHAIELHDMNGDGTLDILTGKRFWAHGPSGDPESNAPAIVMYFALHRDANGVRFVPHIIDNNSGVGTQVSATDLNGDGIPDVIVGNKKGTFVHMSSK